MELESNLGEKLADLRNDRKMKLKDAAKKSGLSYSLISKYENNNCAPTIESLLKLLDAYGVTTEEFYGVEWSDYQKDLSTFKRYGFSEDFFREFVLWEKYGGHLITKCLNLLFEPPLHSFTFFENLSQALDPENHEKLASLFPGLSHDASMRFLLEPVFQSLIVMFEEKYPQFTQQNTV